MAAGDLEFSDPTDATPVTQADEAAAPKPAASRRKSQKAPAPGDDRIGLTETTEGIYAEHCIPGSPCNLTDGCRGRLETLAGSWGGRVQVYCPVCKVFAKGTRARTGFSSRRFFDRLTATSAPTQTEHE